MKKKTTSLSTNESTKKPQAKIATRSGIPFEYVIPIEQKAIFANHFAIQHENGVHHLMFFQVNPPLLLGSHEEKAKLLRDLESVQAVCTARIVVSEELMPKILQALLENNATLQAAESGQLDLVDVSSPARKKMDR